MPLRRRAQGEAKTLPLSSPNSAAAGCAGLEAGIPGGEDLLLAHAGAIGRSDKDTLPDGRRCGMEICWFRAGRTDKQGPVDPIFPDRIFPSDSPEWNNLENFA